MSFISRVPTVIKSIVLFAVLVVSVIAVQAFIAPSSSPFADSGAPGPAHLYTSDELKSYTTTTPGRLTLQGAFLANLASAFDSHVVVGPSGDLFIQKFVISGSPAGNEDELCVDNDGFVMVCPTTVAGNTFSVGQNISTTVSGYDNICAVNNGMGSGINDTYKSISLQPVVSGATGTEIYAWSRALYKQSAGTNYNPPLTPNFATSLGASSTITNYHMNRHPTADYYYKFKVVITVGNTTITRTTDWFHVNSQVDFNNTDPDGDGIPCAV